MLKTLMDDMGAVLWYAAGAVAVLFGAAFLFGFLRLMLRDVRRMRESGPLSQEDANQLFNAGLFMSRSAIAMAIGVTWLSWSTEWIHPPVAWFAACVGAVVAWRVRILARRRMERSLQQGGAAEQKHGMGDMSQ